MPCSSIQVYYFREPLGLICNMQKNIYFCWRSHNILNLSCQEQTCLVNIGFDRYFYHLRTKRWEKHLFKHSFIKQFCPWPNKLILLLDHFLKFPIHFNYTNSATIMQVPVLPNSKLWKYVENLSVLSISLSWIFELTFSDC